MLNSSEAGKGYWGRILWVDLSAGKTAVEELDDAFYQKFLSGVGLGAKVLWDRLPAGADPLGPENILGFTTGLLTDGVKRAAEKLGRGSDQFAVHCGGVEPPMHDPKFDPGFGTAYACEPAPGRHTVSSYTYLDLQFLEKKFPRAKKVSSLTTHKEKYRTDNKGEAQAVDSFYKMLIDGAGACLFGTQIGGNFPLCEWLNAATGWENSPEDYLVIGERIEQLRQAFTLREGLNPRIDFRPHPRLFGDPPASRGPAKGITLDVEALTNGFYQALGWDLETAKPNKDRLIQLGLEEVIGVLYKQG